MSTLLMRLTAPMQSWGVTSKLDTRRTAREPTKSGVIGLVAAALGIRRGEDEALVELSAMRFGVRVDREGEMLRDYHTAKSTKHPYETPRYYLADAVFVVGLESDNEALLRRIEEALAHPAPVSGSSFLPAYRPRMPWRGGRAAGAGIDGCAVAG